MQDQQLPSGDKQSQSGDKFAVSAPQVSLPKGGGAIRGIGEKVTANPVTGTGSLSVPIATSPGRSGFGPQLGLSYDSGAGNGAFGIGWSLSLPAITRRTDKGLPQYRDAEESDVFILFGAEDLVPVYKKDPGSWAHDRHGNLIYDEELRDGYLVKRYRPRIGTVRPHRTLDAPLTVIPTGARSRKTTFSPSMAAHPNRASPTQPTQVISSVG